MEKLSKPLILVSNDDGLNAPGVHAMIDMLVKLGDVVAVCPDTPQSGKSMAITSDSALRIKRDEDYMGARMYRVNGTPVDCVKLAMHTVCPRKPDLVVSGINHGSNASINAMYSGTVGAAFEGCAFGIPSVAFSLTDHSMDADFKPCLPFVELISREVLRNGLPEGVVLNVNIPDCKPYPSEMRITNGCKGQWTDEYKEYTDPFGKKFYLLTGRFVNLEPENTDTDQWCLTHGIVSVVPVSLDRTAPLPKEEISRLLPALGL